MSRSSIVVGIIALGRQQEVLVGHLFRQVCIESSSCSQCILLAFRTVSSASGCRVYPRAIHVGLSHERCIRIDIHDPVDILKFDQLEPHALVGLQVIRLLAKCLVVEWVPNLRLVSDLEKMNVKQTRKVRDCFPRPRREIAAGMIERLKSVPY